MTEMHARPQSTRRQFLTGQAALDAVTQFDVGAEESLPPPASLADRYLIRLARRAMACTFEVFLNAGQYPQGTAVALAALDLVDQLEDQLTVYRESSEVSSLNLAAAFTAVEVEPRLFALLERALQLYQETNGAFDVTAGRLSTVWGFTRRAGTIPAADALTVALECVGSEYVELDPEGPRVRFKRPGLEINLGGIGKGYALDRCAELLAGAGIEDVLLHGGNSSVLARGSHAAAGEADGWLIGVRNPLRPDRRLGHLRLRDRALATSGSGTQFFVHEGRRYGHILDPRTGWPAEGVLTVSVLAASAADADALATAFYVLGPAAAESYCRTHPEVGMVMLCPGERAGALAFYVSGLDDDEWTLCDPT
jgi:thiamine biosynthesis lipoprotein